MSGVTAMSHTRPCGSYGPGHLMHWIQGKKSYEDGQPIIKVKVVAVHDVNRACSSWTTRVTASGETSGWVPVSRSTIWFSVGNPLRRCRATTSSVKQPAQPSSPPNTHRPRSLDVGARVKVRADGDDYDGKIGTGGQRHLCYDGDRPTTAVTDQAS